LPGFRKGKIPKDILFKHFQDQIDRQARENLLSLGFKETVALIGRDPFSRQSLFKSTIKEYDLENGAELEFEYEARPQVPDIDVDTLSLEAIAPDVPSQEEIDEFYKRLQFMFSEKSEITDRVACKGYLVTLTIIRPDDLEAQEREGHFHLVANMAPDWLIDAVVGMELNSVKEAKIPSPDAGKPDLTVQITLHKIEIRSS
jgi:FKBP-type peptidyl-prolyl cis-trans isomerase (trigger factor)